MQTSALTICPYIGSKEKMLKYILPMLNSIAHDCFCEVFGGMGSVILNKNPVKIEIFNDIDSEISCLFRVLKHHRAEFLRCLNEIPLSREIFEEFRDENPERLTDIWRAARCFYILRLGFGAKWGGVNKPSFLMHKTRSIGNIFRNAAEQLEIAEARLKRVIIENRDWTEILRYYDSPKTLFYLDPPYYNCGNYYRNYFSEENYRIMAEKLRNLEGKFVLSLGDVPEIREIFADFDILSVDYNYKLSIKKALPKQEMLITRNTFFKNNCFL